jgi:hypothetical protein
MQAAPSQLTVDAVGRPPTSTSRTWPRVTVRSACTIAPRPAAPLFADTAPAAPIAVTCTRLTPAGTVKLSSAPVEAKVQVVVPALAAQAPPAARAVLTGNHNKIAAPAMPKPARLRARVRFRITAGGQLLIDSPSVQRFISR